MKLFRSTQASPYISTLLAITFSILFCTALRAQSASPPDNSPEAVQSRIERARALIAAHQLETAASELESARGASQDFAVRNIASVMLMSIYLESGNYGRAEALLEEGFRSRSLQSGDSVRTYFALAGQAVNGARTHLARYRTFGINTSDPRLPTEAVNDLDRLRSFLERMIAQAKEISREHKAYDSLSLLEDVLGIRLALARDMEDQSKWQAQYAGSRELLASQTQIASLGGGSASSSSGSAIKKASSPSPYSTRRVPDVTAPGENGVVADAQPTKELGNISSVDETTSPVVDESKAAGAGSLNAKATKRVLPVYPPLAKQIGASGLVRVHVIVDEQGKVIDVSRIEGPMLLRRVAEDAARQWFFEAASSEGRAGRLTGYIDFTFTL